MGIDGQECGIYHMKWNHKNHAIGCEAGVVYIAKHTDISVFKIGSTIKATRQGIQDRLNSLRRNYGQTYEFWFAIQSSCAKGMEKIIHDALKDKQVDTEMFVLSKDDINELATIREFDGKPVKVWR